MIQKTKVKREFNGRGVQITTEGLMAINDWIVTQIERIAERAEFAEIKRFTPDSLSIVSNRFDKVMKEVNKPKEACVRCTGLKDRFLSKAWQIQRFVNEEVERRTAINRSTKINSLKFRANK